MVVPQEEPMTLAAIADYLRDQGYKIITCYDIPVPFIVVYQGRSHRRCRLQLHNPFPQQTTMVWNIHSYDRAIDYGTLDLNRPDFATQLDALAARVLDNHGPLIPVRRLPSIPRPPHSC